MYYWARKIYTLGIMNTRLDAKERQETNADLGYAQANYLSVDYGHLVETDNRKLSHYLVAFAEKHFPLSVTWYANIYDHLPVSLGKLSYRIGGTNNYPNVVAKSIEYVESQVEEAIRNGAEQVVVLRSRLDALATIQSQKNPNVKFFELDQGQLLSCKRQALEALHKDWPGDHKLDRLANAVKQYAPQSNLHFIETDLLKDNWLKLLTEQGFDLQKKTVFVGKGTSLRYTKKEFDSILAKLKNVMTDDSSLVVAFYDTAKRHENRVAKTWDGTFFSAYPTKLSLDAKGARQYLEDNGLKIGAEHSYQAILQESGLKPTEYSTANGLDHSYFTVTKMPALELKNRMQN